MKTHNKNHKAETGFFFGKTRRHAVDFCDLFVFWLASARRRMLEMQPAADSCITESPSPTNGKSF